MATNPVESIPISEFKATGLAIRERVRRTGTSVLVTRRGVPVAEINPRSPATVGADWMGSMRASATIVGDLVASGRAALQTSENELWLSPISAWEATLLAERGRVHVASDVQTWVRQLLDAMPRREAPITQDIAIMSRQLKACIKIRQTDSWLRLHA